MRRDRFAWFDARYLDRDVEYWAGPWGYMFPVPSLAYSTLAPLALIPAPLGPRLILDAVAWFMARYSPEARSATHWAGPWPVDPVDVVKVAFTRALTVPRDPLDFVIPLGFFSPSRWGLPWPKILGTYHDDPPIVEMRPRFAMSSPYPIQRIDPAIKIDRAQRDQILAERNRIPLSAKRPMVLSDFPSLARLWPELTQEQRATVVITSVDMVNEGIDVQAILPGPISKLKIEGTISVDEPKKGD